MFSFPRFIRRDWAPRCIARRSTALGIALLAGAGVANAAKPEIDPSYAEGQTYYMIGPHLMQNVAQTNPHLYAQAEELYLVVYPINSTGSDTDAKTLPSGYQPQCDPCYHPDLPGMFVYHDHVLAGAPGLGTNGTAGANKAPWKIIVVVYDPSVISDPSFTPVKSQKELDDAEGRGEFLPINLGGTGNPYEIETGNVLICPLVAPQA